MTDTPKTNAELLDSYVADAVESALRFAAGTPGSYANHAHIPPQRAAILARMMEPGGIYYLPHDFKNPITVK